MHAADISRVVGLSLPFQAPKRSCWRCCCCCRWCAVPVHLLRRHGLGVVWLAGALEPPKQRELAHTQHLVLPLRWGRCGRTQFPSRSQGGTHAAVRPAAALLFRLPRRPCLRDAGRCWQGRRGKQGAIQARHPGEASRRGIQGPPPAPHSDPTPCCPLRWAITAAPGSCVLCAAQGV